MDIEGLEIAVLLVFQFVLRMRITRWLPPELSPLTPTANGTEEVWSKGDLSAHRNAFDYMSTAKTAPTWSVPTAETSTDHAEQ